MHACECLSRAGADCEMFGSHDLFGAELNLLAPLSCRVGLGPEDKHIRACSPSHSWLGLDTHLISARLFKPLPLFYPLPPALREERKWKQTSIWLRGCGWIEWKYGKQLSTGFCLGFSFPTEGKKSTLVLVTMAFLIWRISLFSFWSPALWITKLCLVSWNRNMLQCSMSELLSLLTVTDGKTKDDMVYGPMTIKKMKNPLKMYNLYSCWLHMILKNIYTIFSS